MSSAHDLATVEQIRIQTPCYMHLSTKTTLVNGVHLNRRVQGRTPNSMHRLEGEEGTLKKVK